MSMVGIIMWMYGKAVARSIAHDIIRKYNVLKKQHPDENYKMISERVWGIWLMLNEARIINVEGDKKLKRFRAAQAKPKNSQSLINVFENVLFIELGIERTNRRALDKYLTFFSETAKEYNLDFSDTDERAM